MEDAPPLVRTCASSWVSRNPGWTLCFLRRDDLPTYIDVQDLPHTLSLQHLSDIARVRLLRQHGGVWADATCYCARPLDDWLPPLMQSGFFAFDRPTRDRVLASWFLASERQGSIVSVWEERARAYWAEREKPNRYYWLHFLFEWETIRNRAFRAAWRNTPRVSADGPHLALQHLQRGLPPPTDRGYDIAAIPVHKLNWKREFPADLLDRWGIVPASPRVSTARAVLRQPGSDGSES